MEAELSVMVNFSYLITFRVDGNMRKRNLTYLLNSLGEISSLEIIIVEQDYEPHLSKISLPKNCKHIFVKNGALFNKSWGLNIAARNAQSELLIVSDADLLISKQTLSSIGEAFERGADAINPYKRLVDLTQEETVALLNGSDFNIKQDEATLNRKTINETPPFCGGLFAIKATLFRQVGGMDERFEGWGGEDNAMSVRVAHFAKNSVELDDEPAYHLWHERAIWLKESKKLWMRNMALLSYYYESYRFTAESIAKSDTMTNGALDKYAHKKTNIVSSNKSELISCLCVTRNRVDLLKRAISCYEAQTYSNRELVIVCEDDDLLTVAFLKTIKDRNIRSLIIPSNPKLSLGKLRNKSIEQANGEYICQWDDDDWYHEKRIEVQFRLICEHKKTASILPRWLIYTTNNNKAYCSNSRLWEGSIMCKKTFFDRCQYSDAKSGEDTPVVRQLFIEDELALADNPDLYVYFHTGANTWDDQHFKHILNRSHELTSEDTVKLVKRISSDQNK